MRRLVALAAAAALCSGCSAEQVTEIIVAINSDLDVPRELEQVDFQVKDVDRGIEVVREGFDLTPSGGARLPMTIGLIPGDRRDQLIHITVDGLGPQLPRGSLRSEARLHYVIDEILLVRINLRRSCINVSCKATETCVGGTCVPFDKIPVMPYTPDAAHAPLDGGPLPDGPSPDLDPPVDAGAEAPLDGPPPDVADGPLHDLPPAPDLAPPDQTVDSPPAPDQYVPPPCTHPKVVKNCYKKAGFWWCKIPKGCFTIGSPVSEPWRQPDEQPHEVTLSNDFEIMQYEVTQAQYLAVMKPASHSFSHTCGTCPADNVTWHQAVAFCNKLTPTGTSSCYSCTSGSSPTCQVKMAYSGSSTFYTCPGVRLPTEAEFEYALRAGTTTMVYTGTITNYSGYDAVLDKIAWYKYNASSTRPVGGKAPNAWGLYDMIGNINEWCQDYYLGFSSVAVTNPVLLDKSKVKRVVKVGDWDLPAYRHRAANRAQRTRTTTSNYEGFRCARILP